MNFYERGSVRIRYEDTGGSGFPLFLIPGGGLNTCIANLETAPFNPVTEFRNEYRCITMDLRNAVTGHSTGPLEVDRPWEAHADDQLGLLDHLKVDKFMVLGFCIGGPFAWGLMKRAPGRVVAAVTAQPVGHRPEMPKVHHDHALKNLAPELLKRRPEITMDMINRCLDTMYKPDIGLVYSVTRDFVRQCQTPVLIMPDDIPSHPYAAAMETARLAPKSELSTYPWKEPKEMIPIAVRQVRSFLRAHRGG